VTADQRLSLICNINPPPLKRTNPRHEVQVHQHDCDISVDITSHRIKILELTQRGRMSISRKPSVNHEEAGIANQYFSINFSSRRAELKL